jgi:hypothetical protein
MHGIRHVTLKTSEMQELQVIMAKGNTLLKECAAMMNMTGGEFRGKLFNKRLDTSRLSAEQLQKLNDSIPSIMEVRNKCETKILNGFARAVYKQAKAAASNSSDPKNSMLEFEQEATLGVLECIYGYTDAKIQFITYVWRAIRRNINRNINRLNPFCPLTNEALGLVQDFDKAKVELNLKMNRFVNTEEVITAMGLTEEQKEILLAANSKVVNEYGQTRQDHGGAVNNDYTGARRGIDNDLQEVNIIRKDVRQALKNAELSDIELHLLLGEMFPYTGWREDIASKFINPRTGKRYTREVTGIIDRAKDKVRKVMKTPPESPKVNPMVDQIFDEMSGKLAT